MVRVCVCNDDAMSDDDTAAVLWMLFCRRLRVQSMLQLQVATARAKACQQSWRMFFLLGRCRSPVGRL